jgi:hypothetical protein
MEVDESEYSDDEEFVENVERMELDENFDSEYCGVDVSFVSNGSTLIAQSPARHSCSKNKCVEGTVKNGVKVVFDVNPTTCKKYALCRSCRAYVNGIGNPKFNLKVSPPHIQAIIPNDISNQLSAKIPFVAGWWGDIEENDGYHMF